jgi:hypothetical protein
MPFTLAGFYESTTGAVSAYPIDALADPHIRVSGDDLWIPSSLPQLAAYYALGSYITLGRIESPTLRTLTPIDVIPLDIGTEPGSPPLLIYAGHAPKPVGGGEALNFKFTATAADKLFGLVWLSDGPLAAAAGEIFTVKATASQTLTAYAWTNAALTFAQTLPSGRYQVVGMRAKSAGLIAARLVFPGYAWRPGCIGCDAYNDVERSEFRHGRMGVWGEFDHDVPPTVDFLSISADTSEEVWLDLIKIA